MAATKGKATIAKPQKNATTSNSKVSKPSARGKEPTKTAADKKAASAATKKSTKKKSAPKLDPDIRCPCGNQEAEPDDPLRTNFVCCTQCEKWQHNICMGLWDNDRDIPPDYYCHECKPGDHPTLTRLKSDGRVEQWASVRLQTFSLDTKDETQAEVRKGWALGEVMDILSAHDALYDYWGVPLQDVDKKWAPEAEPERARAERNKLMRSIEIVLQWSKFAEVEAVRKMLVLGVHDGPVTKTEDIFKACRKLLSVKMLREIEGECTEMENANVRYFFGKSMG